MSWQYLNNQFDNVTKNSNLSMVIITNDHHAKLMEQQADPVILNLLTRTTPLHDAFLTAYNNSKNAIGLRKAATQSVENKLALLRSTTLRSWDAQVQVHFLSGTPEYTSVFPNGLTALHTSTIDQTVTMLKALAERANEHAVLAAVATEIDTFHTELKDLRDAQQGKEQQVGSTSTLLETQRVALANMMYANLGVLMDKYSDAPENIANFWEVQLLQRHNSTSDADSEEYNGSVGAGATVSITSTIPDDANIVITNTGSVPLVFCAAPDEVTACGIDGLTLNPGEVHEGTGADFNSAGSHLNVTNSDPTNTGSYNVAIL